MKSEQKKVDASALSKALKVKSEVRAGVYVVRGPGGGGCPTCGIGGVNGPGGPVIDPGVFY